MSEPHRLLHYSNIRIERAVLNVQGVLERGEPISMDQFRGTLTRIVIAANTVAATLRTEPTDAATSAAIADLLWRFGEELGIEADEARQ